MDFLNIDVLTKYDLIGWAHAEQLPEAWQKRINQDMGMIEIEADLDIFFDSSGRATVRLHHLYIEHDDGYEEIRPTELNFNELELQIARSSTMTDLYIKHLEEKEEQYG